MNIKSPGYEKIVSKIIELSKTISPDEPVVLRTIEHFVPPQSYPTRNY
jgi:hypothetical protein